MLITKEQILDTVARMSVVDVVELISMMEKKFDVSANFSVPVATVPVEAVEEKTEFSVILSTIGGNKVPVIKAVRSATGLGLKEAKDLVESAPVIIKEGLSKEDAEVLQNILKEVGASAEIK